MRDTKAHVVWIDDDPERERDADNLCDSKLSVQFIRADLNELTPRSWTTCDLVLVDYRLDKVESKQKPLRGPAIVGFLRSVNDDIPAYLLSSESTEGMKKFSGLTWFEESLTLDELQDVPRMRERLKSDVAGYRAIRLVKRRANAEKAITQLLKPPSASHDTLLEAVPPNIKAALIGTSNALESSGAPEASGRLGFARWVRRVLLDKPGPLLPLLHAATRVGLTPARFEKSRQFTAAEYTGIFAKSHRPLWWATSLDKVVFDLQEKKGLPSGLPWELGPRLFRGGAADRVLCEVCGEPYPETVARDADDRESEAPVHQRHSAPDPARDFTPFFLEERLFSRTN